MQWRAVTFSSVHGYIWQNRVSAHARSVMIPIDLVQSPSPVDENFASRRVAKSRPSSSLASAARRHRIVFRAFIPVFRRHLSPCNGRIHSFTTPAAHAVTTPSSVKTTSVHGSAWILHVAVATNVSGTSPLVAGAQMRPPTYE